MPNPGPGKALCEAQRTNQSKGLTCHLVAGYGTDHVGVGRCKWHGGCTPTHNEHAQVEQIKQMAVRISGVARIVTPVQAVEIVMGSLNAAWWNVPPVRRLVAELPTHPEPDTIDDRAARRVSGGSEASPACTGRPTTSRAYRPVRPRNTSCCKCWTKSARRRSTGRPRRPSRIRRQLLHLAEPQVPGPSSTRSARP